MTSKSNSPVVFRTLQGSKLTNALRLEERFSLNGISSLQILINKSEDNVWLQTNLAAILLLTWIFHLHNRESWLRLWLYWLQFWALFNVILLLSWLFFSPFFIIDSELVWIIMESWRAQTLFGKKKLTSQQNNYTIYNSIFNCGYFQCPNNKYKNFHNLLIHGHISKHLQTIEFNLIDRNNIFWSKTILLHQLPSQNGK